MDAFETFRGYACATEVLKLFSNWQAAAEMKVASVEAPSQESRWMIIRQEDSTRLVKLKVKTFNSKQSSACAAHFNLINVLYVLCFISFLNAYL